MKRLVLVALAASVACAPPVEPPVEPDPLVVETSQGTLTGIDGEFETRAWLGVPFAAPPVGELRWRGPQSAPAFAELRADALPPPCPQLREGAVVGEEDCLYLNVWRPQGEETLPVYVWVHGGANVTGSAAEYPGDTIAQALNAVVVVVQYRLGPLGFFRHPALVEDGETPADRSGNYGLLDLVAALGWVQDEIESFGGDPARVTVAGESAGAHDVTMLLATPSARGRFHRLIIQSGGMWPRTAELAELNAIGVVSGLGAPTDAPGLRALTAAELVAVIGGAAGVVEDGEIVPEPLACVLEGEIDVPILMGTNEDESKFFLPLFQFTGALASGARDSLSAREQEMYEPIARIASQTWRARYGDGLAARLGAETWVYRFAWGRGDVVNPDYGFLVGAAHATEIPFFHGTETGAFAFGFTPENAPGRAALTEVMTAAERAFVHEGDPSTAELPWPTYDQGDAMLLDADRGAAEAAVVREPITLAEVAAELAALEDEEIRDFAAAWADTRGFTECAGRADPSPPTRAVDLVTGENSCLLPEGDRTSIVLAPVPMGGDQVMVAAGPGAAEGTFDGETLRYRGLVPDGNGALAFEASVDWETGLGTFDFRYGGRGFTCSGTNLIEP